jgi:hypothetical protein
LLLLVLLLLTHRQLSTLDVRTLAKADVAHAVDAWTHRSRRQRL